MKKLITSITILFFVGCSPDETIIDNCKTVTDKKIIYESIGTDIYAPVYYLFLEGAKTKVTKDNYYNYLEGQEYCK